MVSKQNNQSISSRIKQINKTGYEVKNSEVNFEFFKIGYFLRDLVDEY